MLSDPGPLLNGYESSGEPPFLAIAGTGSAMGGRCGTLRIMLKTKPMPKVWNKHIGMFRCPPGAVYVGRPTVWGNPFIIGVDGTREEVIQKYRLWLQRYPELVARAKRELKGKDLICWCAPRACHADVLLEIANAD